MGLLDGVKGAYYSIEEKYYDFLDAVNEKIPVYEVIDPIDRVAPSLLVFIFLGLILLALGGLTFLGFFDGPKDTLTINVVGTDAKPVEGASVTFTKAGADPASVKTDSQGNAKYSGIKENDKVNIKITKDGYAMVEKPVLINVVPQVETITLEKEEQATTLQRTIRIIDSLGQTVTEPLTVRFKCSVASARAPEPVEIGPGDDGLIRVTAPSNCGRLTADISDSTKYKEISGFPVSSEEQTIRLQAAAQAKGTLNVMVTDSKNEPVDGIRVEIYKYEELLDNPNIGPLNGDITQSGQAAFSETPGSYVVRTFDGAGIYGQAERRATITAGETASVTVSLQEDIKGKIKVKVVDKKSGASVKDARVKLVFASSGEEVTTNKTDDHGETEFPISRDTEYKANVIADKYQFKSVSGLKMSADAVKIEIEKCTSTTCGLLRVKVVDQEGSIINNAVVALYNGSTNNLAGYDTKKTDINGMAKFSGVSAGNYWAFAFREGFSGRSDAAYFDGSPKDSGEPNLTVKMDVGKSVVRVHVVDKEGEAVPFANVTILDARTNLPVAGPEFTDANGTFEREIRASAKVYAVVKKEDEAQYTPYTTAKKPLVAEGVVTFEVTLEKPIIDKEVEVLFRGLYEKSKKADKVSAGGKYVAKFLVKVPEKEDGDTYDDVEMHVRTGEDTIMEKDDIYLGEVSAAMTRQARATKFENEATGIEASDYDATVDDAKWVNLEWWDPLPGLYEVEAEVNVKNTASLGDKLLLNYKVNGEIGSTIERDPDDDTVTKELYSNTKQEIFEVGAVTLCDESFCFTSTILDVENELLQSVTDTYNAKIFNKYKVLFIVKNNSQTIIHNKANLRIDNPDKSIKFFNYEALDAETTSRKGIVNGFEFPRLDVGDLSPDKSVRIEAEFIPQKAMNGIVNIKLVSDQQVVYEKNVTIIVSAPQELSVEIDKVFFASGIPTDIKVVVKDSANTQEVDKAVVRVLDKFDNVIDYDYTRPDGTATVTVPGQKPGEKLKLQIEKASFNVKEIELTVSDKLLEPTPSQLGISLNTKDKQESSDKITIRNAAPYDLTIKQVSLKGAFKKLIDMQKVRNWLESSYKGMTIKADTKQEIIVKTFLSQDAMLLKQRQGLDAELEIIASSFGQEWVVTLPAKISVGLGNEVDDPTCLVISKNEWVASTSGSPKRMEFLIQNNCTVGKRPVALQDLEAKLNLKTNQLGEYKLSIQGAGDTILRPGYFKIMLGKLEPQQSLTGILTFTPFGGVNGTADTEVEIQASNPIDEGAQVLNSKIKTKITSVNLTECLNYDRERIAINQKETGVFTITATEICGEPIDFEIKSPLTTNPEKKFTLNPGQSRSIEVYSEQNNPGQYPVVISGKFGSDKKVQLAKNLRIIINAPGCWQLSKYEYEVYDNPSIDIDGFDSAKLTNTCVERPVQVKVNTKDFMDALQDGLAYGAISAGLVMLTNWGAGDREVLTGKPIDPNAKKINPSDAVQDSYTIQGRQYNKVGGKWYNNDGTEIVDKATVKALDNHKTEGYKLLTTPIPPATYKKTGNTWTNTATGEALPAQSGIAMDKAAAQITPGLALPEDEKVTVSELKVEEDGTTTAGPSYDEYQRAGLPTDYEGDIAPSPSGSAAPDYEGYIAPSSGNAPAVNINKISMSDPPSGTVMNVEGTNMVFTGGRWMKPDGTTDPELEPRAISQWAAKNSPPSDYSSANPEEYTVMPEPGTATPGNSITPITIQGAPENSSAFSYGRDRYLVTKTPNLNGGIDTRLFIISKGGEAMEVGDPQKTPATIRDQFNLLKASIPDPSPIKPADYENTDNTNNAGTSTTSAITVGSLSLKHLGENIYQDISNGKYYASITGTPEDETDVREISESDPLWTDRIKNAKSTPTGNVILTGMANSVAGGAAQGFAGGLAGGILKSGGGLVRGIFGTSPLAAGLLGGVVGTAISYMGQEKESTFTVLQPDAEIKNVKLVQGEGAQAIEDDKVKLEVEGLGLEKEESSATVPMPLTNTPTDLISQGSQTYKAVFTNDSGLITTEEAPYYSNLSVEGIRHKYKDKTYKKKDFYSDEGGFIGFFDTSTLNKEKRKLDEDLPSQKLEQTYKLEFNAVPPEVETVQKPSILNCQEGERTGSTGQDALPKVKFAWSWSSIADNECNEDNPNGIYCDATQFSIAVLKKIKRLDDFLVQNASQFQCPAPGESSAVNNEIEGYDVGIASLDTAKNGNDVDIVAELKNTNPGTIESDVMIKVKPIAGGSEVTCPGGSQKVSVGSGATQEAKCTFKNLAQGYYTATVSITPKVSCEKCEDLSATNSLTKNFFMGTAGVGQCSPYSTTRLAEFLKASGMKNTDMVQLANFNALLMVDGYSKDFQHDFDIASNNTFFQAPEWYFTTQGVPGTGLGAYFKDQKLFTFDAYSQPDFTLPGPGTYNVTIDINYQDKDWKLFDAKGKPTANIVVRLEKLKGAEPDSPFYYMPIDGLVGVPPLEENVEKGGRTGYGINFAGDSILIDNGSNAVRTVDIAGSAPIEEGVLKVTKSKNFRAMQVDDRGVVAKLSRANGGLEFLYQPSNATPVILEIEKQTSGSAYAIYQPAIDGDAVNVGPYLTKWDGIGASCRGFDGTVMSQQTQIADTHGISTGCALVGVPKESRYALEFCSDPVNFGKVFYESVFYTPQDSDSRLEIVDVASDEARLVGGVTGKRVPLNGNGVTPKITSMQDIFNLVKDEYMCVTGSNLRSEFFWNPKKLYATILPKEEDAINQCIASPNMRKAF